MENKVAVYLRLSLADEETGFKNESSSISTQRMLINNFLDKHDELKNGIRSEFIDDGFSGTKGDRPGLMQMMECVRAGEFNVICVKDLSRFFRD